jgi:hypothetical protein
VLGRTGRRQYRHDIERIVERKAGDSASADVPSSSASMVMERIHVQCIIGLGLYADEA